MADPAVVIGVSVSILSSIVVVIVGVSVITSDREREVTAVADLAASRLTSALVRRDDQVARDELNRFHGTSGIVSAALFDADDQVLAVVGRTSATELTAIEPRPNTGLFRAGARLVVARPVRVGSHSPGTIIVETDESATGRRIRRVYLVGLGLFAASILLTVVVASGFARARARSIAELVDLIARTQQDGSEFPDGSSRLDSPRARLSVAVRDLVERFGQQSRRLAGVDEATELGLHERAKELDDSLQECRQNADRLRRDLHQREVLLRETHHRIKNNFQIISALLNLEARKVPEDALRTSLINSRDRVHSLALVHEVFCDSENADRIELSRYLRRISSYLVDALAVDPSSVRVTVGSAPIAVDVARAFAIGLIVNELVSNALQHAFPDDHTGTLSIAVTSDGERAILQISDDGVGLTAEPDELSATAGLGFKLIHSLVRQLDGTMEVDRTEGTAFKIEFPLQPPESGA